MNKIYKPFIRLFGIIMLMIWALTMGFIGAILWMFIFIVRGPEASDKFFNCWAKSGEIFDEIILLD